MSRTIDNRNLFGGFVGGMLGILASSFISVIALPFGCVLGAAIGFWWHELGDIPKEAKAESVKMKRRKQLKRLLIHPTNVALRRIYAGRILAVVAIIGVVTWIEKDDSLFTFFISMIALTVSILTLMLRTDGEVSIVGIEFNKGNFDNFNKLSDSRKSAKTKGYYSLLELNDKWGAWLVAREFMVMLGIACFTPVIIAFVIVFAVIFVCLIAFPALFTSCLGGILEVMYKMIISKSYWLCVMITFATTGLIVYFIGVELEGVMLWLAAFSAGAASGLLTMIVSKLLHKVITYNSRLASFLVKWITTMKGASDSVDDILNNLRRFFTVIFSPPRFQYGIWKHVR